MTNAAENERLVALEVEVGHIKADVGEIKSDVKTLVLVQQQLAVDLAVKNAAELSEAKSRASTGVWVRTFLPLGFSGLSLIVSIVFALTR
jgi:hypothetical protein